MASRTLACLTKLLLVGFACSAYAGILDNKEDSPLVSLGCYKCSSVNRSDPDCEDEFVAKEEYYTPNCMAARKSYSDGDQHSTNLRVGLYPATWCIKFSATDKKTGETHMIRDCAADSGGTTYDTEIGGMTHCGLMKNLNFDGKEMKGCILACKNNGCNHGNVITASMALLAIMIIVNRITCM